MDEGMSWDNPISQSDGSDFYCCSIMLYPYLCETEKIAIVYILNFNRTPFYNSLVLVLTKSIIKGRVSTFLVITGWMLHPSRVGWTRASNRPSVCISCYYSPNSCYSGYNMHPSLQSDAFSVTGFSAVLNLTILVIPNPLFVKHYALILKPFFHNLPRIE